MACLVQVGAGSGGMAVLDLLGRDSRIDTILLIEPDIYKPHNVHRHYFPAESCGRPKADLAAGWLAERRPDLRVEALVADLCDPARAGRIDEMVSRADIGVCAVDNDRAKLHWDWLMRRHSKPWTLGEVLAGGIGGFVHMFVPGGPCFACVASQLQRETKVDDSPPPTTAPPGMRSARPAFRHRFQASMRSPRSTRCPRSPCWVTRTAAAGTRQPGSSP